MLLRHTPKEVKEREALTINPAKTCQPIGAMYAALGIHNCLPHSHGSQGCCSYHRSMLTRHYKEPVMATTSSFTEGSAVFGGQANLLAAVENIFALYKPDVIAVHTTCLSETIGDDIPQIVSKAVEEGKVPPGKFVIHANTPSYIGSHVTGFANMVKGMVKYFSVRTGVKDNQVNIIPGWVEPSDMREIKRLTAEMGVKSIMFPDTSEIMDSPQTGKFEMYGKGGVTIDELRASGDSIATLAMGHEASVPAGELLDSKCKVKLYELDVPIGLKATDRFIKTLSDVMNVPVPESIERERGRLVDILTDNEQYFYNKRVALYGDPDQLIPMCEFLVDIGMRPVYVVTGTPGKYFAARMPEVLKDIPEAKFRQGPQADMFLVHQWIKNEPVDLLIGNTWGKYIARDENVPLIRFGFPIMDRVGHSYFPNVGYTGAIRLIEKLLNAILDKRDREAPEEKFELMF
ncbi:MAG: nitrogenase molybdenum-iron protein subunit beta [Candidatus Omnitrophica bacterium]|nr:nitrogenase molybdenum-iron protein subunit beta [Candidatus Omnitrophota bacterium]